MMKFDFLYLECVSCLTLIKPYRLQSAADGKGIAELTCKTLEGIHADDSFKLFWEKVLDLQKTLGVNKPSLP